MSPTGSLSALPSSPHAPNLEHDYPQDRFHPAEIIACRIGPVGLVGLPAEVFVEIACEINQGSPFDPTLVIELTGGAMGYMPHAKGFEEGGFAGVEITAMLE